MAGSPRPENQDELAAPHSITSSARARSVGGTSRPSALAVLRLIASSYLTGSLNREVGRLLTPEHAIDVRRRAPVLVDDISAVSDQTAARNEESQRINRRQPVPGR